MKKNKKVKTGIIVAILLLAVGFAAVTTTLFINGVLTLKPDSSNFKQYVVFVNDDDYQPSLTTEGISPNTPEEDRVGQVSVNDAKTVITFETPIFNQIGEKVTLKYKIENNSQYNAKLGNVACNILGENGEELSESEKSKYLKVTEENKLSGKILKSNTKSEEDTITIEMIRSFAGTTSSDENSIAAETKKFQVRCEMTASGQEADSSDMTDSNNE